MGTGTVNCSAKVLVTGPVLALRSAVWADATGVATAVNCALVVFAWTSAAVVVVTAELLLDTTTLKPCAGAGPLKVSVHKSLAVPLMDALAQVKSVSTGIPAPLSGIVAVPLVDDVLDMLN
jgi:hypothetical protein